MCQIASRLGAARMDHTLMSRLHQAAGHVANHFPSPMTPIFMVGTPVK
jgi:hypothetical protein